VRAPRLECGERDLGREPPGVNCLRLVVCAPVAAVCFVRNARVVRSVVVTSQRPTPIVCWSRVPMRDRLRLVWAAGLLLLFTSPPAGLAAVAPASRQAHTHNLIDGPRNRRQACIRSFLGASMALKIGACDARLPASRGGCAPTAVELWSQASLTWRPGRFGDFWGTTESFRGVPRGRGPKVLAFGY
jgi:hypothetical protein